MVLCCQWRTPSDHETVGKHIHTTSLHTPLYERRIRWIFSHASIGMVTAEFPEAYAGHIDQQSGAAKGVIASNSMGTSKEKPPEREPPPNKPDYIPFEPTQENIPRTESWLRHDFAKSAFNVTATSMPGMQGPKLKIHLLTGTTLKTVHTRIPVPFHWKKRLPKNNWIGMSGHAFWEKCQKKTQHSAAHTWSTYRKEMEPPDAPWTSNHLIGSA